MSTVHEVVLIVGSLRRESYNRMLANALVPLAPPSLRFETLEIGQLPLYNFDLEADPPAAWTTFRQRIAAAEAFCFVTPEYNRLIPGALKNAIDVGSRPKGKNSWGRRPAGVMSLTPGGFGAMSSNLHLRMVLSSVNVNVMPMPEGFLSGAEELFDTEGRLTNDRTREFLQKFGVAFAEWVERFHAQPAPRMA